MTAESNIDTIVLAEFFRQKKDCVLLEIGAADPEYLSIGKTFREIGWRVISIEPNPSFAQLHREKGYEVYEYACSNIDADDVDFTIVNFDGIRYEGGDITMESFSSLGINKGYEELLNTIEGNISKHMTDASVRRTSIKVKVRTARTLIEQIPNVGALDLVSIDTEGWELECLQGFPIDRFRPKVFIVENLFPTNNEVELFLNVLGYTIWRRISPNDVYISSI